MIHRNYVSPGDDEPSPLVYLLSPEFAAAAEIEANTPITIGANQADDEFTVECPRCKAEHQDLDGFGVLHCEACGYCQHPCWLDGVCQLCGKGEPANPLVEHGGEG